MQEVELWVIGFTILVEVAVEWEKCVERNETELTKMYSLLNGYKVMYTEHTK